MKRDRTAGDRRAGGQGAWRYLPDRRTGQAREGVTEAVAGGTDGSDDSRRVVLLSTAIPLAVRRVNGAVRKPATSVTSLEFRMPPVYMPCHGSPGIFPGR
jgi:hypothetical protein